MPSVFGLWGDSPDHLVHLLVAFVLALPIGWHRAREDECDQQMDEMVETVAPQESARHQLLITR